MTEGISINRDLSDWPEGMKRYPIRTKCIVDGTGLKPRSICKESMVTRLEAIEQRLTDTQDVMIDLSEKYDRLEGKYQNSRED